MPKISAGCKRAVADRVEQRLVDLVDEVGRGLEFDELGGHANFWILYTVAEVGPGYIR